jgi:hypothetical protein
MVALVFVVVTLVISASFFSSAELEENNSRQETSPRNVIVNTAVRSAFDMSGTFVRDCVSFLYVGADVDFLRKKSKQRRSFDSLEGTLTPANRITAWTGHSRDVRTVTH